MHPPSTSWRLGRLLALLALASPVGLLAGCSEEKATRVPPSGAIAPTTIDFGLIAVGAESSQPAKVSALTSTPLVIRQASVSGLGFSLGEAPSQVPGFSELPVTVRFSPVAAGAVVGRLLVATDDPDHPQLEVALKGRGGERQVEVSLEWPDGGSSGVDAGLAADFGTVNRDRPPASGTSLLLSNLGEVEAQLTAFRFEPATVGFLISTPPTLPQRIGPRQTKSLPLAFLPPQGLSGLQQAQLILSFDDPRLPEARVALRGIAEANLPPLACAGIAESQLLDGTSAKPTRLGAQVEVEPGGLVTFTPFEEELADAGATPCSRDPEDGRTGLTFNWSVLAAPNGSTATLTGPTRARPTFIPDVPGDYRVGLRLTDAQGAAAQAEVGFRAAPLADLTVRLAWPGSPQVDLDLHVIRPGGAPFDASADATARGLTAGRLDWGVVGDPRDDPKGTPDDQGDGRLEESIRLNHPEASCLADGGCRFEVLVHTWQDRRALPQAATCGTAGGCLEGAACGCSGDERCQVDPTRTGRCAPPVAPVLEVYRKGEVTPSLRVPVSGPSLGALSLPGPCFTFEGSSVTWPAIDGGTPTFQAPPTAGGAALSYWGQKSDATRQCSPQSGGFARGSAPSLSP